MCIMSPKNLTLTQSHYTYDEFGVDHITALMAYDVTQESADLHYACNEFGVR